MKTGLATAAKVGVAAVAAIGTASVAAGKKIWDLANKTSQYGDAIDKNSQRLGLSYEMYQKWDYAMQISGSSIDAAAMGLKTLTNTFDDANRGTATAVEKFNRLGLSLNDLQSLSREELFETVVHALQNVSNETEKAALANDLFGRSGQELLPMLNTTEEELRGLLAEAENYGTIMSDDAVRASAAFQDSLTKLSSTFNGLKNNITANLLPGLTDVVNGFADLIIGSDTAGDQIKSGISNVITELKNMIPQFVGAIGTIISAVAENAPDIIIALANGIIGAIPELLSSFGTAISRTINAMVAFFHAPEQMSSLTKSGGDLLQTVIDGILSVLGRLGEIAIDIVKALADGIPKAVSWLISASRELIISVVNFLGNQESVGRLWQAASDIVDDIGAGIIAVVSDLGDAAVELITSLTNFLTDDKAMEDLGTTAGKIVGQIVNKIIEFAVDLFTAGAEILAKLGAYFEGKDAGDTFNDIGKNILGSIWAAMVAAWDEVKPTLDKISDNLQTYFKEIDWELTGEKVMDNFFESLVRKSVRTEAQLRQFWENLKSWFLNIDWTAVGQSILDSVLNTLTFGIYGAVTGRTGDVVGQLASGAGKSVSEWGNKYEDIRNDELTKVRQEQSELVQAVQSAISESKNSAPYINNVNISAVPQSPLDIYNEFNYGLRMAGIN
ncbi:MAG: hypothetical protein IJE63_03650 [Clostridia bacterium]|nr:hypothetical protein [Clostridia bacterium]